ncbi:MAG: hypothetical protein ABR555_05560 [Pyrinomonadaceae bacterium]
MDEKELITLLRSHGDKYGERGWRCPDDNQLAGYLNGQFRDRRKIEKHCADCQRCLETVAFLVQQFEPAENVPTGAMNLVRSLAEPRQSPSWNSRWAFAAASACVLIVAALLLWQLRSGNTPAPPADLVAQRNEPAVSAKEPPSIGNPTKPVAASQLEKPKTSSTHESLVRGTASEPRLSVIFPRENAMMHLSQQTVLWKPVPEAVFYEVKIVAGDGTPVVSQSTNNTELRLGVDTLQSGSQYFVTIIAHLSGARTVKSQLVKFRVAAP